MSCTMSWHSEISDTRHCPGWLSARPAPAWSRPEALLLAACEKSSRLPVVWANPMLRLGSEPLTTPDLWLDDVAMAIMVHSRQFHSGELDWDRTVESDSDLTAAGIVVLGVTPNRIYRSLPAVVARIERTYLSAQARPRPPVTARRQPLLAG